MLNLHFLLFTFHLVFSVNATPNYCEKLDANTDVITLPHTNQHITVACSRGWIVLQRRINGFVNFQRNWDDYKWGFGELYGDYWLGLEKAHRLTSSRQFHLKIEIENWKGKKGEAYYPVIVIGSENEKYRITQLGVARLYGISSDNFGQHAHTEFQVDTPCAKMLFAGWWWRNCYSTNLNSLYAFGDDRLRPCPKCINWLGFYSEVPLKYVQMTIQVADADAGRRSKH
ncbi:angiopoietin-4-like [Scaptodrosophila lebanonensis]|uniref:Angiopoietin-4-like n=1 Tax=Drosophila lebanonensis TaxID=7225 RepID=A0A6J2TMM9_DROLE|nr:angiopoietin-4-like [Scaptodrosophila lebanonensis]